MRQAVKLKTAWRTMLAWGSPVSNEGLEGLQKSGKCSWPRAYEEFGEVREGDG